MSDVYNETQQIEIEDDMLLLSMEELITYAQATHEKVWRVVINREMSSNIKNNTWVVTDLPTGKRAMGLKWVYNVKKNTEGKVIKHKARLMAKWYVQQQGVNYEETFSLVTHLETMHLLLASAAKSGWESTIWM